MLTSYFKHNTTHKYFRQNGHLTTSEYFVMQAEHNMNPDNFFDRNNWCWTTDPYCGLDLAPKRPWEVLKDPSKGAYKLERDADKDNKARGKTS